MNKTKKIFNVNNAISCLEFYFWFAAWSVLIINILVLHPQILALKWVSWLDDYVLAHHNSPLEELQVFVLLIIIYQLWKFKKNSDGINWFKYISMAAFVFILGEETTWGAHYFNFSRGAFSLKYMSAVNDFHNLNFYRAELLDLFEVLGGFYLSVLVFSSRHFRFFKDTFGVPKLDFTNSMARMYIFGCLSSYLSIIDETSVIDTIYIHAVYVIFLIALLRHQHSKDDDLISVTNLYWCYFLTVLMLIRFLIITNYPPIKLF